MTAVWVKLYIGQDDQHQTLIFKVAPIPSDISDLRQIIKEEVKPKLDHIAAPDLRAYPQQTDISHLGDAQQLNAWDTVPDSTTGPSPMVVIAPGMGLVHGIEYTLGPPQQQTIQHGTNTTQQRQQWYHVSGSLSRPKSHAGARHELFKFASSAGGLYPPGLNAQTAFEATTLPNDNDRTILKFSVNFRSDDQALQFIESLGQYLLANQGDLQLLDYLGEGVIERPAISEISPYVTSIASRILLLDYKPQSGEAEPGSPIVDLVMETRSSYSSVNITLLSTRNEIFRFQRFENSASFSLAEAESAHIFPSAKCTATYEWLDDKPYNRLALSGDVHINYDGSGRGRGKHRKTAQSFTIRPQRLDGRFRTCEFDGVICYEIPLELILNQNDKAEALLSKLGNNARLHKRTSDRWTIDGADVRIFYPQNRRVELVAEQMDDNHGPVDLVTEVPGVKNLSSCWSHSDQNPFSLEAAEVLEKCLLWNYENALDMWSKLG